MKLDLSRSELEAVQWATGQHTESNANDVKEMMLEGLSRNEAKALIRANAKIREKLGYKPMLKPEES